MAVLRPKDATAILAGALDSSSRFLVDGDHGVRAMVAAELATALGVGSGSSPTFAGQTLTGQLLVAAGSTSLIPIKMQSGALASSPAAGGLEFLTDKLYATITTGAARKELALCDTALTSGRVPFMTTNGRLTDSASLVFFTGTNVFRIGSIDLQGSSHYIEFNAAASIGTFQSTRNFTVNATGELWLTGTSGIKLNSVTAAGGTPSAAARFLLYGGTTTIAPLKFTSGTNLTTAAAGAMEYNGTNLFFTRVGTTRENIICSSAVTTEVQVSDTTVTINIDGVTLKLLAKA